MRVHCSISTPPSQAGLSWAQRWEGPDRGLISCWLRGIAIASERPQDAALALAGEFPSLPWKGGVPVALKARKKIGALEYLATWQGLRGADLDVELDAEVKLTCTRTGVTVTFTGDTNKLFAAAASEEPAPP
jgi:hypothetical protein